MSKKEKPVYAFIRKGNALVPDMEFDLAALDGIANGERVRLDIKQFRSNPRLRAYWAMLKDVLDATECARNVVAFHEALKLELGVHELVKVGKMTIAIPGSISFDKMTEGEMIEWFNIVVKYIAENFGIDVADLRRAA